MRLRTGRALSTPAMAVRGGARPVMLATFDVPFAADATSVAVDSAVETGQPLTVVNVAEVPLGPCSTVLGYGYVGSEELELELRRPAELAASLGVAVERLRVCSPHPVDALLQLVAERTPGLLVVGPDPRRLRSRFYRRAARRLRERAGCLVWLADP